MQSADHASSISINTKDDFGEVVTRKVFIPNIQGLYATLEVLDEQAAVQAIYP